MFRHDRHNASVDNSSRSGSVRSGCHQHVYALCVLVPLAYLTLAATLELDPSGTRIGRQEIIAIGLVGTAAPLSGPLAAQLRDSSLSG